MNVGSAERLLLMRWIVLVFPLVFALVSASPARAVTLTVTTTTDELDFEGDCSLREAVQAANTLLLEPDLAIGRPGCTAVSPHRSRLRTERALTSSIYCNTDNRMKTTFDIPDELLVEAKKRAAELRRPLRALVTEGLRAQLASGSGRKAVATKRQARPRIRWVTVKGALAPGLDVANREQMHEWLRRHP